MTTTRTDRVTADDLTGPPRPDVAARARAAAEQLPTVGHWPGTDTAEHRRTADDIYADISREMHAIPTDPTADDFWHAQAASADRLSGLWWEMSHAASDAPPWAQLATMLLADSLAMRAGDAAAQGARKR